MSPGNHVAYLDPDEVEDFDKMRLLGLLSRVGASIAGSEWDAFRGSKLQVDHDFVSAYTFAMFARDKIPVEHEDRVDALKAFYFEQRLNLKNCPLRQVTLDRLIPEHVRPAVWCFLRFP